MKKLILSLALVSFAAITAHADDFESIRRFNPDELVPSVSCVQEHAIPDHTYGLTVFKGGISGNLNTIELHESTIAGDVARTFVVKQILVTRPGAPVIWKSSSIELSINFTVSPRPDRKFLGVLTLNPPNGESVQMLCEPVIRPM
jgi:hypothetical protein